MSSGASATSVWSRASTSIGAVGLTAERMMTASTSREAAFLAVRLIGARTMSLVSLAVALWAVDVESFAAFGVYQALAMLVWLVTFLRFDAAIVAASTASHALAALRLCALVGFATGTATTLASLLGAWTGFAPFGLALLFPLSVVGRGLLRLAFAAATRDGDFREIGRASLVQSVVQPVVLVALVKVIDDGALAFAGADVIGHMAGVIYLTWRKRAYLRAFESGWSRVALLATAQKWIGLPLYNLPGSFLSLAFVTSPLLIAPSVASATFAGHVALAFRIFDVPTQIITAASTPIFLHLLRPSADNGAPIFRRATMIALAVLLVGVYGGLAGAIAVADPWLKTTALGGIAGVVSLVAAFQLFVALGSPLNDTCALFPEQRRLASLHGLAVLGSFLAYVIAILATPRIGLIALVVLSAARAITLGELLRNLSWANRRGIVVSSRAVA